MPCTPTSRAVPRAFTLVELLVVIAVVSLLMSILMPALASAREQAKKMQCTANLRALMQMTRLYTEDYEGMLPSCYWKFLKPGQTVPSGAGGSGTENWFPDSVYRSLQSWSQGIPLDNTTGATDYYDSGTRTRKQMKIYYCPSAVLPIKNWNTYTYSANPGGFVPDGPSSANMNTRYNKAMRRWTDCKRPSEVIALADGPQFGNFLNSTWGQFDWDNDTCQRYNYNGKSPTAFLGTGGSTLTSGSAVGNWDTTTSGPPTGLRYRHQEIMYNPSTYTTSGGYAGAVFFDGHAETIEYKAATLRMANFGN